MINILLFNMRIATLIFGVVLFAIHVNYYKQGKLKFSKKTIKISFYFLALICIAAITSIIRPINFLIRSICLVSLFSSIYIVYIMVNQFIYGKSPLLFNKLFFIFSLSTITIISLLYLEKNNINSFLDQNEHFNLTIGYYLIQVIMFLYPVFAHIKIISILFDGLKGRNINTFMRTIFSIITFYISLCWWSLGVIKISLYVFDIYNHIYLYYLMIVIRILVLPVNMIAFIPSINPWLCRQLMPLYSKLETERLYWLKYLHKVNRDIFISTDKVPDILLNEHRIITELGDMREMLWSIVPHRWPLSARAEAQYIHNLRYNNKIITEYGQYKPHTARFNSINYNIKVSKRLYKLEVV